MKIKKWVIPTLCFVFAVSSLLFIRSCTNTIFDWVKKQIFYNENKGDTFLCNWYNEIILVWYTKDDAFITVDNNWVYEEMESLDDCHNVINVRAMISWYNRLYNNQQ